MHTDPDVPPKWERWLWEVDASEAAEEREGGKGLGVGKIVRAGIALADDEGLEGVSVRKLAQRLSVTAATVTAAVNRLVRKGYVERVPSQEDRRKVLLHLTKSGRKAVRAHDLFHARMIDSILDGMDADEEAALLRSVRRIKEFFDKENEMLRTAPAAHRVDAADVAC